MLASDFIESFDVMLEIQFHAFIPPSKDRPVRYGQFVVSMKSHGFVSSSGSAILVRGRGVSINEAFASWCDSVNSALEVGSVGIIKRRRRSHLRSGPQPIRKDLKPT